MTAAATSLSRETKSPWDFEAALSHAGLTLPPLSIETLQVNLGKLCNQACAHCHVDASPARREIMDRPTVDRCLNLLAKTPTLTTLDLTGGAPELNPHFTLFVKSARALGKRVMVRHNLTVTWDPHPLTGESLEYLLDFFAQEQVDVVSSLPYYQAYFTDKQRGSGVFEKSLRSLRALNERGYGRAGSSLILNLVYNPVGAFLPADQKTLEADFKRELLTHFGVTFNQLFTITNMPIKRYRKFLERTGGYEDYMAKLVAAFNPGAAAGVMCRNLISVGHDGRVYDCDFNQMLDLDARNPDPVTLETLDIKKMVGRQIQFGSHCFGCTAGAGSSCGGTTA
ncbi:MAG: arsenosugar biosynthesis radical SAM protein ArsS [Elusimicrobia bacterium]|nr:arsenosugar biosynthesis radical SAM protein ArsS [Elusimicrobiota bacterium]